MGATNPSVASGVASPLDRLAPALAQPTVTIGGRPAPIDFAGLTPGGVGLYQINLRVPPNAVTGDNLPDVIRLPDGESPRTGPLAPVTSVR